VSGPEAAAPAAAGTAARARLVRVLPHAVMLAASVFLYWATTRIEAYTGGGERIGPDAWPRAIIVFMGLLCAFEMARRLLARDGEAPREEASAGAPAEEAQAPSPVQDHPAKLAGGIALIAGYVVCVPWLGFLVATAVFLAVFPWIGGLRRPLLSVALGVAGSFLLVVLFMRVAYISLPLGEAPFRPLWLGVLHWIWVSLRRD
jgi:hypothetical protein